MFLSVPPAVLFAQSVDRQRSLKPDGTTHAHAHAHHPSAGSRGIGAFFGFSTSRGAQAVAEVPAAGVSPDA